MRHLLLLICILSNLLSISAGQPIRSLSLSGNFPRPLLQEGNATAWKEFSSAEGRFSVLLPGLPAKEVAEIDTRAGQVPNVAYILQTDKALYLITYSEVPYTTDPTQHTRMLDAGRDRMLAGDKSLRLISQSDVSVAGRPGREWVTQDRDSVSIARGFIVNDRAYINSFVMHSDQALKKRLAAPTPENRSDFFEENSNRFLDSFKLLEELGEVDRMLSSLRAEKKDFVVTIVGSNANEAGRSGGVLNGRALHLVAPPYPAIARSAHVSGQVSVKVLIDLEGDVAAAQVVDGHPLLRVAAIRAARETKFTPTQLDGKPVMVVGIIVYNFVAQ